MQTHSLKSSKGAISKMLLLIAAVVIVIVIIVLVVVSLAKGKKATGTVDPTTVVPQPVYEVQIGDVLMALHSSVDLGNTLKATQSYQKDLTTNEKFIRVMIGASNQGKVETAQGGWDVGNIIDSDGRIFKPANTFGFLPQNNGCGAVLKPAFSPILCTKIYEVAKVSEGLKVEVSAAGTKEKSLIDLNIQ